MCLSTPPGMVLRRARRIVSDLPRLSLRACAFLDYRLHLFFRAASVEPITIVRSTSPLSEP